MESRASVIVEIGRPSTYAMFLETLLQRGYVKKEDVEEIKYDAMCFKISRDNTNIVKCEKPKKIAKEHNKLLIQPLGVLIIEFLVKYFDNFFSHHYTKQMLQPIKSLPNNHVKLKGMPISKQAA